MRRRIARFFHRLANWVEHIRYCPHIDDLGRSYAPTCEVCGVIFCEECGPSVQPYNDVDMCLVHANEALRDDPDLAEARRGRAGAA